MKITLFTSNNNRHNYLINLLSNICDEICVVQECRSLFPGKNTSMYPKNKIIEKYFNYVKEAEKKIFTGEFVNKYQKNIITLPILYGELNNLSLSRIQACLVE